MRPSLALALAILICLASAGFRPDGLPFMPSAAFSDAAVSHYPAALMTFRNPADLAWTELNMAGQPFGANPLNKAAYPFQILSTVIPPPLSLNLLVVLHISLGAAGMWFWARQLGLSEWAAAIAATAYALSPRLVAHLGAGHLDFVYAMAWFPLLMARIHVLAKRWTIANVLGTALVAAMLVLADLRMSVFALASATAYMAVLAAQSWKWRFLLPLGGVLLLLLLLTIGVTLPLILWQPFLSRSSLTAAEAAAFSLEPGMLIGMGLAPPALDPEMQTFVGTVTLVLAAIALLTTPRKLSFWVLLIVLATLYAFGSSGFLWSFLVELLPPLRWFRVPARAWFVVALVMPLLAAYGTQALMDRTQRTQRWRLAALWMGTGAGVCGVFMLLTIPSLAESALRLLIVGGATALVIGLQGRNGQPPHRTAALLFTLMVVDLGWNAHNWLEWRGRETWLVPYVQIAETLRSENADRIYSPTYSVPQQVAAEYDLHLFGGVDPFQLRGVADAIETASGVGHFGYSVTQPPLIGGVGDDLRTANLGATPNTALLAEWQVSHVASAYPLIHPRLQEVGGGINVHLYRNLDYRLTIPRGNVPRWASQDGLPDPSVVLLNNLLTTASQFAGSALQAATALITIFLITRRRASLT